MKLADVMLTTSPNYTNPKRMERTTKTQTRSRWHSFPDSNEQHRLDMTVQQCKIIYKALIEKGIASEQARMVLPKV